MAFLGNQVAFAVHFGIFFPVLDDLEDREPRLVERMEAPPWRGYQWPHRDFMPTLRGAADMWVVFISLQDDPPEKSLHEPWLPHVQHVARGPAKAWQLMDGTLIHRGAGRPGRTIFSPFVPENSAHRQM